MSREYCYLLNAGITFGVDVKDNQARIAVTFCNENDVYNRRVGRQIIDILLNSNEATLQTLNLRKNVFSFPYTGFKSRQEILRPLIHSMTDHLGERALFRFILSMLKANIKTKSDIEKYAKEIKNKTLVKLFDEAMNSLDEDEKKILLELKTPKEFYYYFFDWIGSANAIISATKKFAKDQKIAALHSAKSLDDYRQSANSAAETATQTKNDSATDNGEFPHSNNEKHVSSALSQVLASVNSASHTEELIKTAHMVNKFTMVEADRIKYKYENFLRKIDGLIRLETVNSKIGYLLKIIVAKHVNIEKIRQTLPQSLDGLPIVVCIENLEQNQSDNSNPGTNNSQNLNIDRDNLNKPQEDKKYHSHFSMGKWAR